MLTAPRPNPEPAQHPTRLAEGRAANFQSGCELHTGALQTNVALVLEGESGPWVSATKMVSGSASTDFDAAIDLRWQSIFHLAISEGYMHSERDSLSCGLEVRPLSAFRGLGSGMG